MYTPATRPSFYFPYSYPAHRSDDNSVDDLAHVLTTGRRSHKLSATTRTIVWPVRLEASLIKALRKYAAEGHCTKPARRHPKRNRFISDWIYRETGAMRTPKQIGSRIQQLKETCPDPEIQSLINQLTPEEPWPVPPSPVETHLSYTEANSPVTKSAPQPPSPLQVPRLVNPPMYSRHSNEPTYNIIPYPSYSCQMEEYGMRAGNWYAGYIPTPGYHAMPPPFETFACQAQMYTMSQEADLGQNIYAM